MRSDQLENGFGLGSLFHFNDNWSLFIVRVVVGCLACSSFVVRRVVVVGVLHLKLYFFVNRVGSHNSKTTERNLAD